MTQEEFDAVNEQVRRWLSVGRKLQLAAVLLVMAGTLGALFGLPHGLVWLVLVSGIVCSLGFSIASDQIRRHHLRTMQRLTADIEELDRQYRERTTS